MGAPQPLGFEPQPEAPAPPQVFVRTFTVPAGAPWDQSRAANLEARLGGPLPIAELMHRLQRLEPWRPGQVGRFAVFYVRRKDYASPFSTLVDVDGRSIRVAFGTRSSPKPRFAKLGAAAAVSATAAAIAAFGAQAILEARGETTEQLGRLEQRVAAKARLARRLEAEQGQGLALARAQGEAGAPADVIADLAWLTRARLPDARIVTVHWDHRLMAVEARDPTPPVAAAGRRLVRSDRPVRPGVWLWGIDRPAAGSPVSAAFRASPEATR